MQDLDDTVTTHLADYTQFKSDTENNFEGLQNEINNIELTADKVELNSDKFDANNVLGGMEELFTNVSDGKQLIGTAVTDVDEDVVVPTDPTFQQLADAINFLKVVDYASGSASYSNNGQYYIVGGLSFTPDIAIYEVRNTYSVAFNRIGILTKGSTLFERLEVYGINTQGNGAGFYGPVKSNLLLEDGFRIPPTLYNSSNSVHWRAFRLGGLTL